MSLTPHNKTFTNINFSATKFDCTFTKSNNNQSWLCSINFLLRFSHSLVNNNIFSEWDAEIASVVDKCDCFFFFCINRWNISHGKPLSHGRISKESNGKWKIILTFFNSRILRVFFLLIVQKQLFQWIKNCKKIFNWI